LEQRNEEHVDVVGGEEGEAASLQGLLANLAMRYELTYTSYVGPREWQIPDEVKRALRIRDR
jgi:hypothetical protein